MGAAGDGWTYRENRRAFNDFPIMPRRLQGVSAEAIDLRTTLMGHDLPFPMITCPMGGQGMFHAKAEVATSGGTGMAGTLYVSSGAATKPMEDIAKATPGPKWFQIYMNKDMEINRWLVQRPRRRILSHRSDTQMRWGRARATTSFDSAVLPMTSGLVATTPRSVRQNSLDQKRDLSYSDIGFLREASGLPVVVKGIVASTGRPGSAERRRGLQSGFHRPAAARWTAFGFPIHAAAGGRCGRGPRAGDLRQRHPARHRRVQGGGAHGTVVAISRRCCKEFDVWWRAWCKNVYAHISAELKSAMLLSGVARVTALKREHLALNKA